MDQSSRLRALTSIRWNRKTPNSRLKEWCGPAARTAPPTWDTRSNSNRWRVGLGGRCPKLVDEASQLPVAVFERWSCELRNTRSAGEEGAQAELVQPAI